MGPCPVTLATANEGQPAKPTVNVQANDDEKATAFCPQVEATHAFLSVLQ